MLENRSFDHMLGFLEHPDPRFSGVDPAVDFNPDGHGNQVFVNAGAGLSISEDPDHSHRAVMGQLLGDVNWQPPIGRPFAVNNQGFVHSFAEKGGTAGHEIMACQSPASIPVLSTLAVQFAVLDHWFCSVPGQTWPNRNFAHAATSEGAVDIELGLYTSPTVFEALRRHRRDWRIYHEGGIAQAMAFPKLWGRRFDRLDKLFRDIERDLLPHYAFVEPDHFPPHSSSQHPGNSKQTQGRDFISGELLILRIYEALWRNPAVFSKTGFLITYDEHGGFFDHVAPAQGEELRDQQVHKSRDGRHAFAFDLLGPRVPAVLVSPWVEAGSLDSTVRDHTTIIATLFSELGVQPAALTGRDQWALDGGHSLGVVLNRTLARSQSEMPDPAPLRASLENALDALDTAPPELTPAFAAGTQLDEFQASLLDLSDRVAISRSGSVPRTQLEMMSADSAAPFQAEQERTRQLVRSAEPVFISVRLPSGDVIDLPPDGAIPEAAPATLGDLDRSVRLVSSEGAVIDLLPGGSARLMRSDSTHAIDLEVNDLEGLLNSFRRTGRIDE